MTTDDTLTSGPEWPGALLWRESWDHLAHGFRTPLGELSSTGLCGHVARTSSLPAEDPPELVRRCIACLMTHGQELVSKHAVDWRSL